MVAKCSAVQCSGVVCVPVVVIYVPLLNHHRPGGVIGHNLNDIRQSITK